MSIGFKQGPDGSWQSYKIPDKGKGKTKAEAVTNPPEPTFIEPAGEKKKPGRKRQEDIDDE